MTIAPSRTLVLVLMSVVLAACGGGSSSTQAGVPVIPPAKGTSSVAIAITIPSALRTSAAGARRRPLYISINTQSAAIAINGGAPSIVNLSQSSPNCSGNANGRTCTVSVKAPIGNDIFAETLYATPDGSGPVLSAATNVAATIVAGQANTVNLTLEGVIATLGMVITPSNPPQGQKTTSSLTVNYNDASGAAIIGSDPFTNQITLTDSDTSGVTQLSKSVLKSPADGTSLTISYSGDPLTSAVFTASTVGVASASATLTPSSPAPVTFNDYTTFGYDNQRDGFNPNSTAITPQSVTGLHAAWQTIMGGGQGDFNVQSQPILATGIKSAAGSDPLLFVAGGSGYIDAQDALTGKNLWSVPTGVETFGCDPNNPNQTAVFGAGGTVAYDPASQSLYAIGNANGASNSFAKNLLFHLAGASGATLDSYDFGQGQVGSNELNFSHTSVTLNNGIAYVGTGATCDIPSWRGRIAAVNVTTSPMSSAGTFFTVWNPAQGQSWGGGGVWGWGGVSLDFNGNVLAGIGNTDNGSSFNGQIKPPFVAAPQEYSGYGETLLQVAPDLSHAMTSNHPIPLSSYSQAEDLDVNGTPVIFQPLGAGCDPMVALQSKQGSLLIYDETNIAAGPRATYQFAPTVYSDGFLGVAAFSKASGLLYSVIASDQSPTSFSPGMLAINPGCGSPSVTWKAVFGPDATSEGIPRSVPAVSAGGVVFVGTSCDGYSGLCPTVGTGGAIWELDATTGAILNGGKPILYTPAPVRAPPTIDGKWVYVVDSQGDMYGLTIDPQYPAIAVKRRAVDSRLFNRMQRPVH